MLRTINVQFFQHAYRECATITKRHKNSRTHWATLAKKKTASNKALEYFDDLYGNLFGKEWPSIRVALLTQSKYVAVVNNFSDTERIIPHLENLGSIDVRSIFKYQVERALESDRKKKKKHRNPTDVKTKQKVENIKERLEQNEIQQIYPHGEVAGIVPNETSAYDNTNRLIDPSLAGGAANLYEYVPTSKLKGKEDWVPESDHFRYYATDDFPIIKEEQNRLDFPEQLKVYTFVTGCCDVFPPPKKSPLLEVSDYYLMDGASLLPALALDLRPGDNVLDMCAAPGGKSLVALQTLYPNIMTMNDASLSRCHRVRRVMNEFVLNFPDKMAEEKIRITNLDGRNIKEANVYNKILVDAPCTNDRHSVMVDDNNIFNSSRVLERIKIPELQSGLLTSALNLVKVGGTVVYSTCSLSPIQNDGVVHMALRNIYENSSKKIAIIDMTEALEPTKVMYRYRSNVMRYGHLVVPYLPDNYGPMYFCKLVRLE